MTDPSAPRAGTSASLDDARRELGAARETIDRFDRNDLRPLVLHLARLQKVDRERASRACARRAAGMNMGDLVLRHRGSPANPPTAEQIRTRRHRQHQLGAHLGHQLLKGIAELPGVERRIGHGSQDDALGSEVGRLLTLRVMLATDAVISPKGALHRSGQMPDLAQTQRKDEVVARFMESLQEAGDDGLAPLTAEEAAQIRPVVTAMFDTLVAGCVAIQVHEITGQALAGLPSDEPLAVNGVARSGSDDGSLT